jgi:hypothetical protein
VKKYFAHLIAIGSLLVLLAGAALAQDELENRYRADIPFEFYAGSTSLPAGVYTFDVNPDHVVTIERDSTSHAMFVTGMPADPVQNGKAVLTFQRVGDEYRLQEVQGEDFGVQLEPIKNGTTYKTVSAVGNGSTNGGQH